MARALDPLILYGPRKCTTRIRICLLVSIHQSRDGVHCLLFFLSFFLSSDGPKEGSNLVAGCWVLSIKAPRCSGSVDGIKRF